MAALPCPPKAPSQSWQWGCRQPHRQTLSARPFRRVFACNLLDIQAIAAPLPSSAASDAMTCTTAFFYLQRACFIDTGPLFLYHKSNDIVSSLQCRTDGRYGVKHQWEQPDPSADTDERAASPSDPAPAGMRQTPSSSAPGGFRAFEMLRINRNAIGNASMAFRGEGLMKICPAAEVFSKGSV